MSSKAHPAAFAVLVLVSASCTSLDAPEDRIPGWSSVSSSSVPSSSAVAFAPRSGTSHGGRLLVGRRSLDEDDWTPVEDQLTIGAEFDWRPRNSPVGVEFGVAFSTDSEDIALSIPGVGLVGAEVTGSTSEFYVGALFTTTNDMRVRPYGGVGISLIRGEIEADIGSASATDDDLSPAAYVHGGVAVMLGKGFELGADLRAVFGSELDFSGFETDADYVQFAMTFGYRF